MDAAEALRTIAELKAESTRKDGQIAQMDTAIADLKGAVKALGESRAIPQTTASYEGEDGLRKHVTGNANAPIAWTTIERADGDSTPGLLDSAPSCDWQRDLQALVEQRTLIRGFGRGKATPKTDRALARHCANAPASLKGALPADYVARIFADSSGVGSSFVPDVLSPMFYQTLLGERRVAALFPSMPMPMKELRIPFVSTFLTPYKKGAATTDDPGQYRLSSIADSQISVTATGLAVRTQVDEDAEEDAIISVLPLLQQHLVGAIVDGEEDALINGDTTATHQDTITGGSAWNPRSRWASANLGGSDDHRRLWIGLRARGFDVSNTTDSGSAQTFAGIQTVRSTLASPHGVSRDLVIVTSPEVLIKKLMTLSEVVTLEKYGPGATVFTGEVGKLGGSPVVISEFMTADLAATGLYTGAGALSSLLMFNRTRFVLATRREVTIESQKDITRGVTHLVATKRGAFFTVDSASHKNVAVSYNWLS